jgi:RNA polymerase sigma-70 factor (family 1)
LQSNWNPLETPLLFETHKPLAIEQIYQKYWEEVFDAAYKRVRNIEIAQDITQEIFISLWEKKNTLTIEGNLSAYFYGAVKYKVINYYKSGALKDKHEKELSILRSDEHADAADNKIILRELDKQIENAILLLPDKMRLVFSMSRIEEKSIKEIASELNLSIQTVKNQISTALKSLRTLSYLLQVALLIWLTKS